MKSPMKPIIAVLVAVSVRAGAFAQPTLDSVSQLATRGYETQELKRLGTEKGRVIVFGLAGKQQATAEAIALLPKVPDLLAVSFHGATLADDDVANLAAIPQLKILTLYKGCSLSSGAAKQLSRSATLEVLIIRESMSAPLGDIDLTAFAEIKTLRSLDPGDCSKTSAVGCAALAKLPALADLTLRDAGLQDDALKALTPLGKQLRGLTLTSRALTADGWAALEKFTALEFLNADGSSLGDRGMPAIGKLSRLKELIIRNTAVTDEGLKSLKGLTELNNVYVENTAVTGEGLAHLRRNEKMGMILGRGSRITDAQLPDLKKLFPNSELVTGQGTIYIPAPSEK